MVWTPQQAVRVQGLARALYCVLGQDILLSPPRGYKWVMAIYCWGIFPVVQALSTTFTFIYWNRLESIVREGALTSYKIGSLL